MNAASRRPRFRYRYRLLAGMLALFLPIMVVLAWWLTARSSSSLKDASLDKSESVAGAVALRLQDWVDDRSQAMAILSTQAAAIVEMPFAGPLLAELDELFDFEALVITDAERRRAHRERVHRLRPGRIRLVRDGGGRGGGRDVAGRA